jgi:signal transduction histidine kinase
MARSIRLRLLGWNAAVLTGVVGGFAGLLYYEVRAARLRDVDARLEAAAAGLESALRLFPSHELTGEPPPPRFPRPHWPEPPDGGAARGLPPTAPGSSPGGPWPGDVPAPPFGRRPGPLPRDRLLAGLDLPGPPGASANPAYFAVWRADGTLLKEVGYPPAPAGPPPAPRRFAATRGANRELATPGPGRTVLLVGAPCGDVYAELTTFAWQLAGTGAAVLAVGLGGGWLISRRIFRPVDAIAGAAARISAANLSERIDTASLDAELVGLGRVLNETFGRLQEAFDRQARFTADASHELRTPLAVLRSQAELTLSRARTPEEYREALRACLRAAERMAELAERLLTLARADAGWPGARREPVELERMVTDALAQLAPAAEAKGVTVEPDLAPARTTGDAAALAQVVTNLVGNAIQYNRPGGRVAVRLAGGPGAATLTVEDNGVGIPEADRPRVFERFYRADKARSRASGGTGLGLAICKAVVEVHGGKIGFEPTPGGGSTFRVTLPAAAQESAGTPDGAAKGRSLD